MIKDEIEQRIAYLKQRQAQGDNSRLTALRINSLEVLRVKFTPKEES